MHPSRPARSISFAALLLLLAGLLPSTACETGGRAANASTGDDDVSRGSFADLPEEPETTASSEFWDHWGDGKAELAGYRGEISRYGELRSATAVMIYVTEPHDRRTWVKDNSVSEPHRVDVLKLNRTLKFQTGTYPYSVMTSVFSPVDDWGRARFQPTKITMSSQEWCGNVFSGLWPGPETAFHELRSYFASEGDSSRRFSPPEGTLYQDALPIQLRELDGPFNGGEDWSGDLVPSLWHARKDHVELAPVEATIERTDASVDGTPVHRFTLSYADVEITYDIEREAPHRLVRWTHSDGSHLELIKSTRLPYWKLNEKGDESYREELGLEPRVRDRPPAPGEGADSETDAK